MKPVIAYVSDVILGRTGEVISCAQQREAIYNYAEAHGMEVVAIFEDTVWSDDLEHRPGIQALLSCRESEACKTILVERIWSLSRCWRELKPFLWTLKERGKNVECATTMWDCVSQRARHFSRVQFPVVYEDIDEETVHAVEPPTVRRPSTQHFLELVRRQ